MAAERLMVWLFGTRVKKRAPILPIDGEQPRLGRDGRRRPYQRIEAETRAVDSADVEISFQ